MSRSAVELARVRAALERHRAAVEVMDEEWGKATGVCCAGCMFGQAYFNATERVRRVEEWLGVLESRAAR